MKHLKKFKKSKEEAWNEFLEDNLPVPLVIAPVTTTLDDYISILYILDKNFKPIETKESNIFNDSGDLTKEATDILRKYGFKSRDIIIDDSIEEFKMGLFTEFLVDSFDEKFKGESSLDFINFEKSHKNWRTNYKTKL